MTPLRVASDARTSTPGRGAELRVTVPVGSVRITRTATVYIRHDAQTGRKRGGCTHERYVGVSVSPIPRITPVQNRGALGASHDRQLRRIRPRV